MAHGALSRFEKADVFGHSTLNRSTRSDSCSNGYRSGDDWSWSWSRGRLFAQYTGIGSNIVASVYAAVSACAELEPTDEEAHVAWKMLVGDDYSESIHGRLPRMDCLTPPGNETALAYAVAMAWIMKAS